MKKFTQKLCLLLALLTISSLLLSNLFASAKSIENSYSQFVADPYYEVTSDYLNGIRDKLVKLPGSGSVCIDYLSEEILLHRALLFTAHNIQSYSNNPELIDITDEIIDNYTGELREMREELAKLIDTLKDKEPLKEDSEYIKEYKLVIDKLVKDLAQVKSADSNELTYIKQAIALLQASHDIALIDNKCTKSKLVKEISQNTASNTEAYISRLKTLETAFK